MGGMGYLFAMLLFFLILVAISRWVFRINDIVNRLDSILKVLKAGQNIEDVKKPCTPEITPKPESISMQSEKPVVVIKKPIGNRCPECNYIFANPCPDEGRTCPKCKTMTHPEKAERRPT
jgi:hypothetical protein